MARKTQTVVIENEKDNRDSNKRFLITEMPVLKAERLAVKVGKIILTSLGEDFFYAMKQSLDANTFNSADLANIGFDGLSKVPDEDIYDVMQELMDCVRFCPDKTNPNTTRPIDMNADDIEEMSTALLLKRASFTLTFGSFMGVLFRK